jgi:hypothetical protein
MMFYVDFERGVSVSFVFIRSLFGCQPEHLESLSSDTSADSRLSGRHQYAPSMNPCRQDVRSCMGDSSRKGTFDRVAWVAVFEGGYSFGIR